MYIYLVQIRVIEYTYLITVNYIIAILPRYSKQMFFSSSETTSKYEFCIFQYSNFRVFTSVCFHEFTRRLKVILTDLPSFSAHSCANTKDNCAAVLG